VIRNAWAWCVTEAHHAFAIADAIGNGRREVPTSRA
jgi:hypothetical protein